MNDDVTKPRREDVIPPDVDLEAYQADDNGDYQDYDDEVSGGPGCLVWGIMGAFGLMVALAIVLTAIFAGFNEGLDIARVTSVAATNQNIGQQCNILPTDIAAGRFSVVESRFNAMTLDGTLAPCAQSYVQVATSAFEQSLITPTIPPTAIPTATATAQVTEETPAPETTEETVGSSDSPYDLPGLLSEARDFMAEVDYTEAISTLDAIRAIDATFETDTVNTMLYSALTQQATIEFRTPDGSLAEGILLVNRAEQFGDVQLTDLAFERSVAELYLDARANYGLNYQLAISLLIQVTNLSPNYPRGSGEAALELREQYEAYGDALLAGGEACLAESQFLSALSLSPNAVALQTKANTANEQCTFGVPATIDPNATPDPNATVAPGATSAVAPIGQEN